ncbi:hypothetical protein, partial [Defluviitalea phaphyphila]|uniref:hypothetical protein n=1 Tax=Defluviitalea phaphyphila TaxID=1473580 RepID=UPI002E8E2F27
KDGTYRLSDGYFGVIIRDEYEKAIGEFVKEIYKDFKVYAYFGVNFVFSEKLNKDTKVSEIYEKDDTFRSEVTVLVKESEAKEKPIEESLKKIVEKMEEAKLFGKLKMVVVHDNRFDEVGWSSDTINIDEDVVKYGIKYIWVHPISGISEVETSGIWRTK